MSLGKRILIGRAALLVAGVIWIPCLHLFFAKPAPNFYCANGLSPTARKLAARHLQLWTEPKLLSPAAAATKSQLARFPKTRLTIVCIK